MRTPTMMLSARNSGPYLCVFFLAACAAEPYGTTNVLAGSASWELRMDTASGSLIDSRCVTGGDCSQHPNPFECENMAVSVNPNGQLCGVCNRAGFSQEVCGGFTNGLPYDCNLQLVSGQACVVCSDFRGVERYRDCSASGAPAAPGQTRAGCLDINHAVTGQPCTICLDDAGALISSTCAPGASGGDIAPTTPTTPTTPNPGEEQPGDDRYIPEDPSQPQQPDPCMENFHTGSQAFVNNLNSILAEAGFPGNRPRQATEIPTNALTLGRASQSQCGSNRSDDYLNGFQTLLPFYMDSGNQWTRFGKPRCMLMGLVAAERTLEAPCARGDACLDAYIMGVQTEQARSVAALDDVHDCQGSPIVLDLDGDGVTTAQLGTEFDLGAMGASFKTAWIRTGDALLARDLDGDGSITSGVELFGEATLQGPASDGYAVLRSLDTNHDGFVDAADSAFGELLLWADDGDAISQPEELVALSETDIVRLDVNAIESPAEDESGSTLGLWSAFERADGSQGVMCDVFFATGE